MDAPQGLENQTPKKASPSGTSRNTAILVLCIGIASFLWLLIKLSDSYTWRVPAALVYANLPENKVAVRELPKKVELLVTTTGFKLLLARFRIINITLPVTYRENTKQPYLLSSDLVSDIANEMPLGYTLISLSPDTIFLEFDKKTSRKVPVKLSGEVSFAKQYEVRNRPTVTPDSIWVSGPASILDTLSHWPTETLVLANLKESKKGNVQLQKPQYSSIELATKEVSYELEVESFTQITREIEIELINVPRNKRITAYPKKVKVFVHVGLSNLDAARSASITAQADFAGINLKKDRFVEVRLSGYADFLKISGYEPRNVEFIVYN